MTMLKKMAMTAKLPGTNDFMNFEDKGCVLMSQRNGIWKWSRAGMLAGMFLLIVLGMSSQAFAGAPAKNAYGAIVDSGATLQPDGSQQAIGTSFITLTSGGLPVTTYTVTILGTSTVAAGEVTGVYVTDGTSTWSNTGSFGPGSAVACTGSNATPVDAANLTISLTLAASSAGKTVGVELTSEDSGTNQGLPTAGTLHNIAAGAVDTLSVTANTPVASSAAPSQTVQMQVLQLDTDNAGNGSIDLTTVTVDDIGTAGAGDFASMDIYIDDDADFGNGTLSGPLSTGSWGGTSTAVDITPLTNRTVAFGTSTYLWIIYEVSASIVDGTQLQSSVTNIAVANGENGASGTWNSNNLTSSSGPSANLADCSGCHEYFPASMDAASRDASTGKFVGDHDVHNAYTCATCHVAPPTESSIDFAHRNGTIQLDQNNIGVGTDNGTYSVGGGSVTQTNSPTTGTCSLVDCHSNNITPQWGVGTTACDSCHALPPTSGAHSSHYTAKGWATGATANCVYCHTDNTGGHSDVTDNSILYNATLVVGGTSPDVTCSSTGTGCHNGNPSPLWVTDVGTVTCTDCHTVDGGNTSTVANPVSGLHGNAVASVQDHDATLTGGCEACHVKGSITGHWDGVASATADYTKAQVGIDSTMYTDAGGTGATRGSCLSNTDLATCHSDGGEWRRQWSTDADADIVASPLPGQAVCNVCHGQYSSIGGGWNEGTVHYRSSDLADKSLEDKGTIHTDAGDECEDCHAYDSAASHNGNNLIDFSGGGTTFTVTWGSNGTNPGWYCSTCHDAKANEDALLSGSHTFLDSLAFPSSVPTADAITYVTGTSEPEGDCFGCHGDGVAEYWPQNAGNDRDLSTDASFNNDGRHSYHMSVIATRLGITLPGTDAQQRQMCNYCHQDEDGDHMTKGVGEYADVFPNTTYAKHLNGAADGGTLASYDPGTDTCSNVDCHNSKTSPATYGWYEAGTSTCTMCHTPGGAGNDPNSGLHTGVAPTTTGIKHDDTLGTGCTQCHTSLPANSQTSTHINGTFTGEEDNVTNLGLFGTYSQTAADTGTCATTCHSGAGDNGTWARQWDSAIHTATNGNECAGCHGGFDGTWNVGVLSHTGDPDGDATPGEVQNNHGADDDTTATMDTKCSICHVYNDTANSTYTDSTSNIGWVANGSNTSTYHGNGSIDFNSHRGYSTAGGTCSSNCHQDNTNHGLGDSGWGNPGSIAGAPDLACTDCHGGGSPSAGVSSTSSHTKADGATWVGCEECHSGHADGTTGVNDHEISTTPASFQDKYSGHAGGYIQLGGTATTGSTSEADFCWGCHDALGTQRSEWGTNTGGTYNYGAVYTDAGKGTQTARWLGTYWTSANFAYKEGWLNNKPTHADSVNGTADGGSTHGVRRTNFTPTGVDAEADIGCSACHDVHNTDGGSTGAPYLRGSWTSNPFREDGAPRSEEGHTWADYLNRSAVPRAGASMQQTANNEYGGWQTEDNNTYTRAGNTNHGGLCVTCHTGLGTNWKHGVVVDGLSGGSATNIFDESLRGTNGGADTGNVRYAYPHHALIDNTKTRQALEGGSKPDYVSGLRDGNDYGDGIAPTAGKPDVSGIGTHVATVTGNVVDPDFHQFPCSKCHNPHASRLPRLLITNCLDVAVNTWDDARDPSSWAYANHKYTSTQLGYSPTAGNCHRYVGASGAPAETGQATGASSGWNTLTPWQ